MVAVANKPKPRELCPTCYEAGIENDLVYKPGAQYDHFCSSGHKWDDRDQLSMALMKMAAQRRALQPPKPTPVPDPNVPVDDRIKIDKIDQERIRSFLGDFNDSSTLFGLIFAMNEQMKDLREKLERAETRVMASQVRKIGGDHEVTVNIPERHVQTTKDTAESGGMSIERYIQANLESALDNGWF